MAAKQKTLTIRVHLRSWRQWRKAAQERKISLTKLLELAMDKEVNGNPYAKLEGIPVRTQFSA